MSAPSSRKRDKQRKRDERKKKKSDKALSGPATVKEKRAGVISLAIMAILIVVSTVFIFTRMN